MSTTSGCPACCTATSSAAPTATPGSRASTSSKAKALPGVHAVLTADDLKPLNLHYMPTLAGDVQAVLADEKVLFAEPGGRLRHRRRPLHRGRRGRAGRGRVRGAAAAGRPVQGDAAGRADAARGHQGQDRRRPRRRAGTPTTSSPGRSATRRRPTTVFAAAEVTVKELISYQRVHPCPLETCACVASMDKIKGELTIWGTFQAPHVVRTVVSLLSGIPEHKMHVIAPDIGGGFGNKVGVYPGYVCAIVGSIVLGLPVKWVEDRMENLSATAFARDYHMTGRARGHQGRPDHRPALPRAGRPRRVRRLRRSDQVPGRLLPHLHRLLRHPGRARRGRRRLHQQGAGRRRLSLLVPGDRGELHDRADRRRAGAQARHGPGRAAAEELHPPRAVPLHVRARLGIRQRRLPPGPAEGAGRGRLRRRCARSRPTKRAKRAS